LVSSLDVHNNGGNPLYRTINATGEIEEIELKHISILFKDFTIHRVGENHFNFYDICTFGSVGSNSVTAIPVDLVSCTESWNACFLFPDKKNHYLTKNRKGVNLSQPIPLFDPNMSEDDKLRTRILIEQCGRCWVSGGKNNIDMSLQHASNMYVCQQSSLIYNMFKDLLNSSIHANNMMTIRKDMTMTFLHIKSFISLTKLYPELLSPMEPLARSEFCCDVLQRMITSVMVGHMLNLEDYLRMLELSLKRSVKRFGNKRNLFKNVVPGMTAMLLFPPLYRKIYNNLISLNDAISEIITVVSEYLEILSNNGVSYDSSVYPDFIPLDVNTSNKIILNAMIKKSDIGDEIKKDVIDNLYDWCMNRDNRLVEFSLDNIVEKPNVDFNYNVDTIKIRTHKLFNRCRILKLDNSDKVELIAKNPSEWSGIMVMSPGFYEFSASILGVAEEGKNNTRKNHMTAVVCFTTGLNILPIRRFMITSAGELTIAANKNIYNYKTGINLNQPFTLTVAKNRFEITQNDKVCFTSKTRQSKVTISFKYVKMDLLYTKSDYIIIDNRSLKRLFRDEGSIIEELYSKRIKIYENCIDPSQFVDLVIE
jgi:hypothetical protein